MVPDSSRAGPSGVDELIGAALLALADPEGVGDAAVATAPLAGPQAEEFGALVAAHGLVGPLVDVLDGQAVSGSPVVERLRATAADDRLVRLRVGGALGRVAGALDRAGIEWVAFKGPLVARLMGRPELRTYNDLDLLVAADRFADAIDVLTTAGAVELNENWEPYLRHRVGEVPLMVGEVAVDLHWHLLGLRRVRRTMRLLPAPMLARRRTVAVGELAVPTFDAADQLLHLAVHAALSGALRLDQLRDLAVVLAEDPPDLDELIVRARRARVARLVAHPLDRSRRLLGAPLEEEAVFALGGRSVAWRRRAESSLPQHLRGGRVSPWRDTPIGTARAYGQRLRDQAAARIGRGRGWDFTDAGGRLYHGRVSGGARGREAFLAQVPRWASGE